MNTDKCKNSKMLPPADQQAFQKNAESLLHVAARVLPVHTRKHKIVLKKDPLVEPLTEHSIHESDVGLKSKTKKMLQHWKISVDTAQTAVDDLEKEMNIFAEDELGPSQKALEKAEEYKERCNAKLEMEKQECAEKREEVKKRFEEDMDKGMAEAIDTLKDASDIGFNAVMEMKKQWYAKEWEDSKKRFEEDMNEGMAEAIDALKGARDIVNKKTDIAIKNADKAEALKKELKKLTRHLANAKEDQMKPLDIASKFDFVGGGAIHIARHQLTGAQIDLNRLLEAAKNGIKQYPVAGCYDIHKYIERMSRYTIIQVLLMIRNLGVEENPDFRGVCLRVRSLNESHDSLIVRVVEALTPKDLHLPVSIQNLKDVIESKRIAKVAKAEKREKENAQLVTVVSQSKKRCRTDTVLTPLKLCSSSAPNSSSLEKTSVKKIKLEFG